MNGLQQIVQANKAARVLAVREAINILDSALSDYGLDRGTLSLVQQQLALRGLFLPNEGQ